MKNQKGFAVIEGLLILVIMVLIGGTGWYVWHAKQNADANLNNADKSNSATANFSKKPTAAQPQAAVTPEDYVKYENKDIGFSFAYPEEWGSLTFGQEQNQRMNGNFAHQTSYVVRLYKKTVQHLDTDSPTLNLSGYQENSGSFTLLGSQSKPDTQPLNSNDVLASSTKKGQSYLVFRQSGEDNSYTLTAFGKLDSNSDYNAVMLDYLSGVDNLTKDNQNTQLVMKIMDTFRNL